MAQHPLKALLLKPAANAGWKWERLEVASCIAALCWNKSVEQRSASYVSQELAQTAATGLHCSPTGQGKKGLKGLCISGHYVSAHAAHVNLLHFLTLLHSAFHLGSPRPSGHKWSVSVLFFFHFSSANCIPAFTKVAVQLPQSHGGMWKIPSWWCSPPTRA